MSQISQMSQMEIYAEIRQLDARLEKLRRGSIEGGALDDYAAYCLMARCAFRHKYWGLNTPSCNKSVGPCPTSARRAYKTMDTQMRAHRNCYPPVYQK